MNAFLILKLILFVTLDNGANAAGITYTTPQAGIVSAWAKPTRAGQRR